MTNKLSNVYHLKCELHTESLFGLEFADLVEYLFHKRVLFCKEIRLLPDALKSFIYFFLVGTIRKLKV